MQTTNPPTTDPAALVRSLFDAFAAGDVETCMAAWRDDAVHTSITEPAPFATFTKQQYWQDLLPGAVASLPGYQVEVASVVGFGPLGVAHLRSTWDGGRGEGLMIFRVVDGQVVDVWALNADGRDATTWF